jgi:hypothetical protein
MTNVKLYDGCNGVVRPACFHCHCRPTIADDLTWTVLGADPSTPTCGNVLLYSKSDSAFIKDDAAAVCDLKGSPTIWAGTNAPFICTCNVCIPFSQSIWCATTCACPAAVCTAELTWNRCKFCILSGGTIGIITASVGLVPNIDNCICLGVEYDCFCQVWANAFNNASDCNLKEQFTCVDYEEVLNCYSKVPITKWQYRVPTAYPNVLKGDDTMEETIACNAKKLAEHQANPDTNWYVGPTAQDWNCHLRQWFDEESYTISNVNHNGIQEAVLKALTNKIQVLREELEELKK